MRTLMRIASDDPAALRALAAHWAGLDPQGMLHALFAENRVPEGTPGRIPSLWRWASVLFDHWAKSDLPGAIRALTDAPDNNFRANLIPSFASLIMETDPDAGLRLMSEWGIRHFTPDMKGIAPWAARDPRHAAETVLKYGTRAMMDDALKEVAKVWGKSDPAGGLRFAATLAPEHRAMLGPELMRAWAGADLAAAANYVAAQQDTAFRHAIAPGLVETWGASDPAAALDWSEAHLQGRARTDAIAGVIRAAAAKSLTTASQLVSDMPPGPAQNRACAAIFETWFKKGAGERDAALEWVASLPDPAARTAALETVESDLMWKDPRGVRDFVSGPHGDLATPDMVARVVSNEAARNPEAAMAWAGRLGEKRAADARRNVLASWLRTRPEAAANYVRALPAGPERASAMRTVATTLAWQAPEQAGAWLRTLSAAEQKAAREALDQDGVPEEKRRQIEAATKKL